MNKLVKKLDKRCEKRDKESNCRRKVRVISSDSSLPVPSNAPAWAIKQNQVSAPQSSSRVVSSVGTTRTHLHAVTRVNSSSSKSSNSDLDSD